MKTCTKCKNGKAATIKFYSPDKRTPDGFQSQCRQCRNEQKLLNYKLNRAKFLIDATVYRQKHKERIGAWFKAYNKSPERIEYLKKHRTQNKRHYREQHKTWRQRDPARSRIRLDRYMSAKEKATPSWLSFEQKKEIRSFYKEAKTLSWLSDGGLSVDHIIPFQNKIVCGLHVPWNLQIIPKSYNSIKGSKLTGK